MKKKLILVFLTIGVLCVALGIIANVLYKDVVAHPFKTNNSKIELEVKSGDNLNNVISLLEAKNLLKNEYIIKYYIKKNNVNVNIKPGQYIFLKDDSLAKLIGDLVQGKVEDKGIKITIQEGLNIEQIAEKLQEKNIISKDDFLTAVKNYDLPTYVKVDNKRRYAMEGFLFPDTYDFKVGSTGKKIIDEMVKRFQSVVYDIGKENSINIDYKNLDDIINMASIVEKEAVKEDERAKIASVFYNRLKKNMKLESCATVLYALNVHKDKLYNKDIKVQSPYNTYIVQGLQVGPICNPGKSSIVAAINPEKTDLYYFVSKNDGTHAFSKTYDEHMKMVKQYQGGN